MADEVRHLSREMLEELLHSDYPSPEAIAEAVAHLLSVCPTCKGIALGLATEEGEILALPDLVHLLASRLALAERSIEEERAGAQKDFEELMALSAPDRRVKIKRATVRFRSLLLVNRFIEESHRQAQSSPFEAHDLAECAYDLSLRLPIDLYGKGDTLTAIARANAARANALRIVGDFRQAERLLDHALSLFDRDGSGDPEVDGELRRMAAALHNDQRRFEDAERSINRAISRYRELHDNRMIARCLVQKGILLRRAGNTAKALRATEQALPHIDPERDRHLLLCAEHNSVDYLLDLGRITEAVERHERNRPLYAVLSAELGAIRYAWLEGRIARGQGEREKAERLLEAVKAGLMAQGMGFAAAIAGLDLALVYLEARETGRVRQLAEEMIPIFLAQDVHREAIAALLLFQEAARQEAVTSQMVVEIMEYMRRVRNAPTERPS